MSDNGGSMNTQVATGCSIVYASCLMIGLFALLLFRRTQFLFGVSRPFLQQLTLVLIIILSPQLFFLGAVLPWVAAVYNCGTAIFVAAAVPGGIFALMVLLFLSSREPWLERQSTWTQPPGAVAPHSSQDLPSMHLPVEMSSSSAWVQPHPNAQLASRKMSTNNLPPYADGNNNRWIISSLPA